MAQTVDQAARDATATRTTLQAGKVHCCSEGQTSQPAPQPKHLSSDAERELLFAQPASDTNGHDFFVYDPVNGLDPER